jgi:hypothetical protein
MTTELYDKVLGRLSARLRERYGDSVGPIQTNVSAGSIEVHTTIDLPSGSLYLAGHGGDVSSAANDLVARAVAQGQLQDYVWVSVDYEGGPRTGRSERFLTNGFPPSAISTGDELGVYVLAGPTDDPDDNAWRMEWRSPAPRLPAQFEDLYPEPRRRR